MILQMSAARDARASNPPTSQPVPTSPATEVNPSSSTEAGARTRARENDSTWAIAYKLALGREPTEFIEADVRYYLKAGMQEIVIAFALKEAAAAPAPSWRYAAAILERCVREGVLTLDAWDARQERRYGR